MKEVKEDIESWTCSISKSSFIGKGSGSSDRSRVHSDSDIGCDWMNEWVWTSAIMTRANGVCRIDVVLGSI